MRLGAGATLAFILIRALQIYGDPNPWQPQPSIASTVMDFINTTKYPPSLLFLLMTLGPAMMLCAVVDRIPAAITRPFTTYGRVPFAFYVAHFYLIHLVAVLLGMAQGFAAGQMLTMTFFFPRGYGVGLPAVYILWLVVVLALYPLCVWMRDLKDRRTDWWLSYL
jgi:uncharacterized membrane protein